MKSVEGKDNYWQEQVQQTTTKSIDHMQVTWLEQTASVVPELALEKEKCKYKKQGDKRRCRNYLKEWYGP